MTDGRITWAQAMARTIVGITVFGAPCAGAMMLLDTPWFPAVMAGILIAGLMCLLLFEDNRSPSRPKQESMNE